MIDIKYLIGICALLFGGTIWLIKPIFEIKSKTQEKWIIALLISSCLLSLAYYTDFGHFRPIPNYGNQAYNPSDTYHYYMGSKYFKETGYYDLYACTSVAIREMKSEHPEQSTPGLFPIRNLRDKRSSLTAAEVWTEYRSQCHEKFTPQRWNAFKKDLRDLFNIGSYNSWWRPALFDEGFNPTPVFVTLSGPVANLLPISHVWKMIGYIDFLLIAISAFFIYRAFGIYPLMGFLLIFGTNVLSSFVWTGGSFLRFTWLASLTMALCLIKKKEYFWAGSFFACSTGERIFPVLFFIGALVPLAYEWLESKGRKKNIVPLIQGFVISASLLFLLSLSLYGFRPWHDFLTIMKYYNQQFVIFHVGLIKVITYYHGVHPQNFQWETQGMRLLDQWSDHLTDNFNSRKIIYYPITLFLAVGSAWVSRKKSPCLAALLVGGSLFYALLTPAQYYYMYLALFPVVAYEFPSTFYDNLRLSLIFLLILALLIIPMLPPDDILLFIYFSCALGMFFFLQILNGLWEEYRG